MSFTNNDPTNGAPLETFDIKICVLGDSNTGKSSLINRLLNDTFSTTQTPTVGGVCFTKSVTVLNNLFKYHIWDISGKKESIMDVSYFCRGATVFILVYDCTEKETLENVEYWNRIIQKAVSSNLSRCLFFLCGNKTDKEDEIMVTKTDGMEMAKAIGYYSLETSALTGYGLDQLFLWKLPHEILNIDRRMKRLKFDKQSNKCNQGITEDTDSNQCCCL